MAQITGEKHELPTAWASEQKIKEKAPDAIKFLERKDALDLIEILGLES
jgi:hypothetical protein